MNSFELNKIAMVLLLTVLALMGLTGLVETVFEDEHSSNAFPIEVEVVEEPAVVEAVAVVEGPALSELLALASMEKGVKVFKKCKICHSSDNGGKNMIGPNLWDIVGRAKAASDGYSYSDALKTAGGDWTYEDLDAFLNKPDDFISKTKMKFSGLKKSADRAAVIVLLRSFSDTPAELPAVASPVAEVAEEILAEEVSEEASEEISEEVSE